MQPDRNIRSYPDTARRGQLASMRIPLSIALLSAGFAGMSLSPATAQVAGDGAAGRDRRLARRHQAARAGTRSHPRAAKERRRTAGEAQGRYRGDRTGPQQAQPAADRHRRPGARRRDQDRRRRSAAAPARQPANSKSAARSIRAAPRSSRCWPRCNARDGARRRRCWSGRKTRCNRFAPRCCSDRWCPNCAPAREQLAGDLGELVALAQDHRFRARPACGRPRQAQGRPDPACGAGRRTAAPAELDRKGHGGGKRARHHAVPAGRQPAGPDRQDGAGFQERGESGGDRQPAGSAGHHQRQAQSGGAQGPVPDEPGDCVCLRQGLIRVAG